MIFSMLVAITLPGVGAWGLTQLHGGGNSLPEHRGGVNRFSVLPQALHYVGCRPGVLLLLAVCKRSFGLLSVGFWNTPLLASH